MTLLTGINHAAIMTADLDRFVEFYTTVFGAEVIFQESAPAFRHAMLRVGQSVLHPAELPGNPHATGLSELFRRGHLDHLGLNIASKSAFDEIKRRLVERGASDGEVSDLGPQLSVWFEDPDGMRAEICWIRDPGLKGFHSPRPLREH